MVGESIGSLRARLKTAAKKDLLSVSQRTCLDILAKLKRDGLLPDDFFFTMNGSHLLTRTVLNSELSLLCAQEPFRFRVSELGRILGVSEYHVLCSANLLGFFCIGKTEVINISEYLGFLKNNLTNTSISELSDNLNLPIVFIMEHLVPILSPEFLLVKNRIVHGNFFEEISHKLINEISFLTVPKDIGEIVDAVEAQMDPEFVLSFLQQHGTLALGRTVFVPRVFTIQMQHESDLSLATYGWVPLATIKWLNFPKISDWIKSKFESADSALVLSEYVILVSNEMTKSVWQACEADETGWFDLQLILCSKFCLPANLTRADFAKLAAYFLLTKPLSLWKSTQEGYLYTPSLVDRIVTDLKPRVKQLVDKKTNLLRLSEKSLSHLPVGLQYELVSVVESKLQMLINEETERAKFITANPQVSTNLDSAESVEKSIFRMYLQLHEICSAEKKFKLPLWNLSLLLVPIVDLVFQYVAMTQCGVFTHWPPSRLEVISAIPNSIAAKDVIATLKSLNSLTAESFSLPELQESLKDLQIVVPKKWKKNRLFKQHFWTQFDQANSLCVLRRCVLLLWLANHTGVDFSPVLGETELYFQTIKHPEIVNLELILVADESIENLKTKLFPLLED